MADRNNSYQRRLKIAYILPDLSITGGAAVVLQHTNRLLKRGHDVMVAAPGGGPLSIDWFPGQSVPVVKLCALPEGIDLLVATQWSTAFEAAGLKARHKCYFVQSDETRFYEKDSFLFHGAATSYLMNYHFFTEAKWIQKWLQEGYKKTAAHIPNGLDREIFFPVRPLKAKGGRVRVLLEGNIKLGFKGMDTAFEIVQDMEDVEVWCVSSSGKPKPHWRCDMFFKAVTMDKMRDIYSSCDILLKVSRVEGFFGPPLEMMACGGVCVVGRVSGYDEYIIDGENALVVDPLDIKGAREAVERLMHDMTLREKLRQNGLATAAGWDWEASIDKLERFFYDIIDGKYGLFGSSENQIDCSVSSLYKQAFEHYLLMNSRLESVGLRFLVLINKLKMKILSLWSMLTCL